MERDMHHPLVEKGITTLFKELGPFKTIEFFQRLGINKGDSVKDVTAYDLRAVPIEDPVTNNLNQELIQISTSLTQYNLLL